MLEGTSAWIAMILIIALPIIVVRWFKRMGREMAEEDRLSEARFISDLGQVGPINEKDKEGLTPLLRAIEEDWQEGLNHVFSREPDPNLAGPGGFTPLHLAARLGESTLVTRLLDIGAEIDAVNDGGQTPMWLATGGGDPETVSALHKRGARLDLVENSHAHSPLMIAAMQGQPNMVDMLLSLGADALQKDSDHQTAADLAEANLGQNMSVAADTNQALHNMIKQLRAAETGTKYVPETRQRPVDDYEDDDDD